MVVPCFMYQLFIAENAASKITNLLHHVGMVEEYAGYQAGLKLVSMASFTKGVCLNHVPGLAVTDDRCIGFAKAMVESGIEYAGEIAVPKDNLAKYIFTVESAVNDDDGDWEGIGMLLTGSTQIPEALELKKKHPGVVLGSFDTSSVLYQALETGDILFGIDQQPYLQGYLPIPILTHAATTKQYFLDHTIESGPSFVISTPSMNEAACVAENVSRYISDA